MTLLPRGVKVHLAFGFIDMRKGIDGLAMLVQGVLRQDPFSGHLFVFRAGRPTSSRSCTGMAAAFAFSPSGSSTACSCGRRTSKPGGTLMLTSAQLSMLIDGVDWRAPERQWRPAVAG
jgi:transposase